MVGPSGAVKSSFGTGRPRGRPANISLDQYCTSYRHSYDKELFQPCLGYHFATGYSANHRPVLHYSPSLDRYDNPQFGLSLLDSFESQSKRHYQRLVVPDGTEPLACSGSRRRESGYLQLQTPPRPRATSCQSEYKGSYVPHRLPVFGVSDQCLLVGPVQNSGYTEGTKLQPNTFLPQHINMDDARGTQESVMRTDFLPGSFLQGSEALPKLAPRSLRETGFTRETQRPLTSSASTQGGVSEDVHKNKPTLERLSIGPKGSSGFVLNAPNITSLSHTPADPRHFLTHYQSKFCNKSPDPVRGGIQGHRKSGYSGRDTDRFNLSGYKVLASQ